ncbi:hypothetical protein Q4I28_002281 [Leishmania naiffi]|uniref:Uncharacterized protein n=1 Tax=Leishmania naiffi TaxID=5678 RepID=A0AAW3C1Z7_9TRYP
MVSASSPQRDCGSPPPPPTPPLPGPHDVDVPATGALQALRQAVQVQEAHVRLLRMRKTAREALLRHVQRLLATGNSIEPHGVVEHLVQQAEASLQRLQEVNREADAPAPTVGGDVTPTCAPSLTPQDAAGAADVSADPLARIFHSDVEMQLAAAAEPPHVPSASILRSCASAGKKKGRRKKKEANEFGFTNPARATSPPPSVSLPPRSATTTALLALAASRQDAGHAAMLAALSTLDLSPTINSGGNELSCTTEAGRGAHNAKPPWLRQEEGDGASNDDAALEEQHQGADGGFCDSVATDYTDDFECRSSSSSSSSSGAAAGEKTTTEWPS